MLLYPTLTNECIDFVNSIQVGEIYSYYGYKFVVLQKPIFENTINDMFFKVFYLRHKKIEGCFVHQNNFKTLQKIC